MTRISSRLTFYYKWVLPLLLLGLSIPFLVAFFASPEFLPREDVPPAFKLVLLPAILIAFGLVLYLFKFQICTLADEVWLGDNDELLVRKSGITYRVPLYDCRKVLWSPLVGPPQVTLQLRHKAPIGDKFTFIPAFLFIPFATPRVVQDLQEKIEINRAIG